MCPSYHSYFFGKNKNKNPVSHFTSTILYPTRIPMDLRLLLFWGSCVSHRIQRESWSREKAFLHPWPQCCIQRGIA